jgi:hypothetical protein
MLSIKYSNNFNDKLKSYFFIKEQILLFSPSAYKFIMANNEHFNILYFNDYFGEDKYQNVVKAFDDIYSLFSTNILIQTNEENRKYFTFIAEQLQNNALLHAC